MIHPFPRSLHGPKFYFPANLFVFKNHFTFAALYHDNTTTMTFTCVHHFHHHALALPAGTDAVMM